MPRSLKQLLSSHRNKKGVIKKRLREFEQLGKKGSDARLFAELCFCICTPQSKARACDAAIKELSKNILFSGTTSEIATILKKHRVRFPGNKARFIIEARYHLLREGFGPRQLLKRFENDNELRRWLVRNIKGFHYKEASHFLRNIGRGHNFAILDRHILSNLKKYGVIRRIPALTEKSYLAVEEKMKLFAKKIKIPLAELDLLLWAEETGEVFK